MNIKSNLQNSLSDQKSRVFLFVMIATVVVVSIFYTITFSGSSQQIAAERPTVKSKVKNPATGVASIPGTGKTTQEYKDLEKRYKEKELEKAQKLAESGQPTAIISSLDFSDVPEFKEEPKNDFNQQLEQRMVSQQQIQLERQRERDLMMARQKIDEMNKKMLRLYGKQAEVLADNWKITRMKGDTRSDPYEGKPSELLVYINDKINGADKETKKPSFYYKAGDILFGVILTSVNSDQPGPVLARVLSGPLSNSKIVGVIDKKSIPKKGTDPRVSKALVLEFNVINVPGARRSIPVKAVAIDPETARTSLASSVDNHYMLRYGTFFASQFLAGLGKAISQQTATTVVTANGTADIGRTGKFSGTDQTKMAVGSTAQALADNLNFLELPPTIEVAAGTAIGILLQEDLEISSEQTDTSALLKNNISTANNSQVNNPTVASNMANNTSNNVGNDG